jgi:type 1 glutamine amidotransferase
MRIATVLFAFFLLGACSDRPAANDAEDGEIRVLVVTATHGYRHTGAIEEAGRLFSRLNGTTEFRFTVTETLTDLAALHRFDVLFFANSTLRLAPEHPEGLNDEQQAVITRFIEEGGGFVGAHSALDACYGWAAYRAFAGGGLFHSHPWTQSVRIVNELIDHPATTHFGEAFELKDEIYLLDTNPRPNVTVLLSLDPGTVDLSRLPPEIGRSDFPISWTLTAGSGRIFMTKLGHFPEVWRNPAFLQHLLQGLRYAAGRLKYNDGQGIRT